MSPVQEVWTPVDFDDFSGGMNLGKSDPLLEKPYGPGNEMKWITNMVLDERGLAKKREGTTALFSAAITGCIGIDSFIRWEHSTGNFWVIAAKTTTNTKIYKHDGTTATEITGGSALLGGYTVNMILYGGYLLIYNGNVWQYWNGTTATKADVGFAGGSAYTPIPRIIEISDDRLFVVDATTTYNQVVFYSIEGGWTTDPGTDIDFPTANQFDTDDQQGDYAGVTTLFSFADIDHLLNFTKNVGRILMGENETDYSNEKITREAGSVSPTGIVETDDGTCLWVGKSNIYALGRTLEANANKIVSMGDQIWPIVKTKNMSNCSALYAPEIKSVLFAYLNGVLVWHKLSGGWTKWSIKNISCMQRQKDSTFNRVIFSFSDDGNLYYYGGRTDKAASDSTGGTNFGWRIESPEYALGSVMTEKVVEEVYLRCQTDQSDVCNATVILNSKDGGVVYNKTKRATIIYVNVAPEYPTYDLGYDYDDCVYADTMSKIATANYDSDLRGNTFKVIFENTSDDPITIYGFGVKVKTLDTN